MFKNVYNEILAFTMSNHLVAIFLICAGVGVFSLFALRSAKSVGKKFGSELLSGSSLLIYSLFASLLLYILPAAVVLRRFQTVFFTYTTLWVMIPVIPVTAFVLTTGTGYFKEMKKPLIFAVSILIAGLLLTCGNLGTSSWKKEDLPTLKEAEITYKEAEPVLKRLNEISLEKDIVFLTTPAITEYAHLYSGNIKTLYGRDIWDGSLAAYNYTVYSGELKTLYDWMLYSDSYGSLYFYDGANAVKSFDYSNLDYEALDADPLQHGGVPYGKLAAEVGADAIVFSVNTKTDRAALEYLESSLSATSEFIPVDSSFDEGYLIMYLH